MDGTINLGIYDQTGKLVRILHQNAQLNDFTIGPDSLVTRWDGKDEGYQDLPPGRYHARGYLDFEVLPSQAYVVEDGQVRSIPEEPVRGAARVASQRGRRW